MLAASWQVEANFTAGRAEVSTSPSNLWERSLGLFRPVIVRGKSIFFSPERTVRQQLKLSLPQQNR